jgi:acetyl-CoA carboxylase biotin carboxyl carrier protein
MTFKEIKELIEIFDESNLAKLSLEEKEFKIELDKNTTVTTQVTTTPVAQPVPTATASTQTETTPAPVVDTNAETINSPMVGTFYQAPSPESPAYVKVGDKVKANQTVCIVEAMKIMNEIQAEYDCEILEILVEDGQAVEFDTPLFKVKRV